MGSSSDFLYNVQFDMGSPVLVVDSLHRTLSTPSFLSNRIKSLRLLQSQKRSLLLKEDDSWMSGRRRKFEIIEISSRSNCCQQRDLLRSLYCPAILVVEFFLQQSLQLAYFSSLLHGSSSAMMLTFYLQRKKWIDVRNKIDLSYCLAGQKRSAVHFKYLSNSNLQLVPRGKTKLPWQIGSVGKWKKIYASRQFF